MTEEWKNKLIDLYNEAEANTKEKYALETVLINLKLGYYTHEEVWAKDNTSHGWKSVFHFGNKENMTESERIREELYQWEQNKAYENRINSEYTGLNRW